MQRQNSTIVRPAGAPSGRSSVITAADAAYARCLHQFLLSAERNRLHQTSNFAAYDLGLGREDRRSLSNRFSWCEWRDIEPVRLPDEISALELKCHAWKPFVIRDALARSYGPLLWLDSATLFRRSLRPVFEATEKHGVYCLRGQSALEDHCDPGVLDTFGVPNELRHRAECASGVLGFDPRNCAAHALVELWCQMHLVPGAAKRATASHKSDQALLSIALFRFESEGRIAISADEVDISSRRPISCLSTRNKVPRWVPTWLDRLVRSYYRVYKILDRAWLNARFAIEEIVNGLTRMRKEHFSVSFWLASERKIRTLRSSFFAYNADPFLVEHNGQIVVFFERMSYLRHRGELWCARLDGAPQRPSSRRVLTYARHASFPFILKHDEHVYMIPETCHEGGIHLYVATSFPDHWSRIRTLIPGVDAADTTGFFRAGLWWLITSIRETKQSQGRYLAIFHSPDLLAPGWVPHPVNVRKLYAQEPYTSGRNAGAPVQLDGRLLRPSQRNVNYYGENIRWKEIVRLSPTEFDEVELDPDHPLARFSLTHPMHHASVAAGGIAWDTRDRMPRFRRQKPQTGPSGTTDAALTDVIRAITGRDPCFGRS